MLNSNTAYLALRSEVLSEVEVLPSLAERTHLIFDQIVGLIDGTLAGEELQSATDHVSCCAQCHLAVSDLRAFKSQVAFEFDQEDQRDLAMMAAPTIVSAESRWQRLVAALRSFWMPSPTLAFGSALAALLLVASGWMAWQSLQQRAAEPPIAAKTSSSSVASSEAPMIIARLNDGDGEVTLDQKGRFSGIDQLPPAYRQMVERAVTNQEMKRSPLLAELNPAEGTLRGGNDNRDHKFSAVKPIGGVVLSDHPTFHWSRLDGATGYTVEVYDDNFDMVATSPQIVDPSWTVSQSLKRGKIYYWQVKGFKDGHEFISPRPPAPQAKFRILDRAKANELAKARRDYASSHLTLGLLYAQAGLLDEAEVEFRVLQKANPDSELPAQLLKSLRAPLKK